MTVWDELNKLNKEVDTINEEVVKKIITEKFHQGSTKELILLHECLHEVLDQRLEWRLGQ